MNIQRCAILEPGIGPIGIGVIQRKLDSIVRIISHRRLVCDQLNIICFIPLSIVNMTSLRCFYRVSIEVGVVIPTNKFISLFAGSFQRCACWLPGKGSAIGDCDDIPPHICVAEIETGRVNGSLIIGSGSEGNIVYCLIHTAAANIDHRGYTFVISIKMSNSITVTALRCHLHVFDSREISNGQCRR